MTASSLGLRRRDITMKQEEHEDSLPERSGKILLAGNDDAEDADEDQDGVGGILGGNMKTDENGNATTKSSDLGEGAKGIQPLTSLVHPPISADDDCHDDEDDRLISTIIAPSPFPHHLAGPSSDRLRNALHRVASNPTRDTEAWSALLSEAHSSYRSLLQTIRRGDVNSSDEGRKLDWIESCYGALLKHFPYASAYYVSVAEMLMQLSALPDEEEREGVTPGHNAIAKCSLTDRQRLCEKKLEWIFRFALGINDSDSGKTDKGAEEGKEGDKDGKEVDLGGMCTSSVDLWLLYVRKRSRDANRAAESSGVDSNKFIRESTVAAYETALSYAAFVHNNHLIWRQYLSFVNSWGDALSDSEGAVADHTLQQMQKQSLRSIYQRLVSYPMTGLDQLWNEYEAFERQQSEQLAQALIGELLPKYQHSKSVFLERNRVYNVHELHVGRLATPPVDLPAELGGDVGSSSTVASWDDYSAKMSEESMILAKWRRRCGYERTNPERLPVSSLAVRIRQAYREAACAFTRHPEVWHEWAMWELLHSPTGSGSSSGNVGGTPTSAGGGFRGGRNVQRAIEVLKWAQSILPDCALLVASHANIVECHSSRPSDAVSVLERFISRSPNTLGFVLLQRLARKYGGIREARAVFARARRSLRIREEDAPCGRSIAGEGDGSEGKDGSGKRVAEDGGDGAATGEMDGDNKDGGEKRGTSNTTVGAINSVRGGAARCMVTNRLRPIVGGGGRLRSSAGISNTDHDGIGPQGNFRTSSVKMVQHQPASDEMNKTSIRPGVITWHLYAVHATIEHRVNRSPDIAARVYELGLRKHRTFLSTPPYVLQYANLLFELNDEENLRALLTRAIAACEELNVINGSGGTLFNDPSNNATQDIARRERQRSLWDMMLQFESLLSSLNGSGDATMVQSIETRRRRALYGPGREDVGGGGIGGPEITSSEVGEEGDNIGIGIQKSTLGEQLIRSDGYDVASRIVNGLSRLVDILEVTGALGDGGPGVGGSDAAAAAFSAAAAGGSTLWTDDRAGGLSDASYQRRLRFARDSRARALFLMGTGHGSGIGTAGTASVAGGTPVGGTSAGVAAGKLLTAREKFAQSAASAAGAAVTGAAVVATSPEWLRGLLLALPPIPRPAYRGAPTAKPPPHMIEMALASLRGNALPSRPAEDGGNSASDGGSGTIAGKSFTTPMKRRFEDNGGGGDSSDEENGGASYGSGYGNQFRSRQRARQVMMSSMQTQQQKGVGAVEGDSGGGPS